jgi:hypothetical protein
MLIRADMMMERLTVFGEAFLCRDELCGGPLSRLV